MFGRKPKPDSSDNAMRCSFCKKSLDAVGKLISTPIDYPRAYICEECVRVCYSILEDKNEPGTYSLIPPGGSV